MADRICGLQLIRNPDGTVEANIHSKTSGLNAQQWLRRSGSSLKNSPAISHGDEAIIKKGNAVEVFDRGSGAACPIHCIR